MKYVYCILLAVFLGIACTSTAAVPAHAQDPGIGSTIDANDDAVSLAELIEQLGDRSFAKRQVAAEEVWKRGPGIRDELEKFRNHPDTETAKRVQAILSAFDLGVDMSTPRATALMVMQFKNSEPKVRTQIVQNLRDLGQYKMLLDLVAKIEDRAAQKKAYNGFIELDALVALRNRTDEWDEIDSLLRHPLAWKYEFRLSLFWAIVNGEIDDVLRQRKTAIDKALAKIAADKVAAAEKADEDNAGRETGDDDPDSENRNPESESDSAESVASVVSDAKPSEEELAIQADLQQLIQIYRVLGDYENAIGYAEKLVNASVRDALTIALRMESGQWAWVAERTVSDQADDLEEGKVYIKNDFSRRAITYLFANDTERLEALLKEQAGRLEPAPGDEKDGEEKKSEEKKSEEKKSEEKKSELSEKEKNVIRNQLANVFLLMGDWERAREHLDTENTFAHFDNLCRLHRFEEAFQLIELGDTLADRVNWFKRYTKRLKSIHQQYRRTKADTVETKSNQVFSFATRVATQLGQLGAVDEAILHLRMLADSIEFNDPGSSGKRGSVLLAMIALHRPDDAWQLVEDRFTEREHLYLRDELFGAKSADSNYWYPRFVKPYPNLLERYKFFASLMNTPLRVSDSVTPEELEAAVAAAFEAVATSRSEFEYRVAHLMKMNGRMDAYYEHLKSSADMNYYTAFQLLGKLYWFDRNWAESNEYFERSWRRSNNTLSLMLCADIAEKQGDSLTAKRLRTAGFSVLLEAYRASATMDQFKTMKWLPMLEVSTKVMTYCPVGKGHTNESYRKYLVDAVLESDKKAAANHWRVNLYNQFGNMAKRAPNTSAETPNTIVNLAQRTCLFEAKRAVIEKNPDQALERVRSFMNIRPGDTEVAVELLKSLQAAGFQDHADALFADVQKFYEELLAKYPASALHNNNYAWICAASKRNLPFAKQHVEIALQSQPLNAYFLDTKSEIMFQLGDVKQAMELCIKSIQLRPDVGNFMNRYRRLRSELESEEKREAVNVSGDPQSDRVHAKNRLPNDNLP